METIQSGQMVRADGDVAREETKMEVERRSRPGVRLVTFGLMLAVAGILTYLLARSQLVPGADNTQAYRVIEVGFVMALLAAPLVLLGFLYYAPRAGGAAAIAWFGALLALIGTALFSYFYPFQINQPPGNPDDYTLVVVAVYGIGLVLMLAGQVFSYTQVVRRTTKVRRRVPAPAPAPSQTWRPAPPGAAMAPPAPQFPGRIFPVAQMEGVGPVNGARLHRAGVYSTAQLMAANPAQLSQQAGINEATVLDWQSQADLSRIESIDSETAQQLARAGVLSTNQLAQEAPDVVVDRLQRFRAAQSDGGGPILDSPHEQAEEWRREAFELVLDTSYPWMLPRHTAPAAAAAPAPFLPGQVVPVTDIEGVGPVFAEKLTKAGVHDSSQLLLADPDALGERIGVSPKLVRQWQAMADLDRLANVNNQQAELLARAGVLSVTQLARERPREIMSRIESYLERVDRAPTDDAIDIELVKLWVREATRLSQQERIRPAIPPAETVEEPLPRTPE